MTELKKPVEATISVRLTDGKLIFVPLTMGNRLIRKGRATRAETATVRAPDTTMLARGKTR